jgi:hypothetical protein
MMRAQDCVFQEAPGSEQRLSELQAQIDRLTIALQLRRDGQDPVPSAEERLARFADQCAGVLDQWSTITQRHARAVQTLEQQVSSFTAAQAQLHDESADRFLVLERMVAQEWAAARRALLALPVSRDQAAELTEACLSAASPALDLTSPGDEDLFQQFAPVLGEEAPVLDAALRPSSIQPASSTPASKAPEPEHITEIAPTADAPVARLIDAPAPAGVDAAALRSEFIALHEGLLSALRKSDARVARLTKDDRRVTRRLSVVIVLLIAVLAVGSWWVATLQQQIGAALTTLQNVEQQSTRATAQAAAASEQLAAAKIDAERLAAAARAASATTDTMGAVLAAPDLGRYGLTAVEGSHASAQLLWSRARGFVLSAVRLPAAAGGTTYQVWLFSNDTAVSAGTFDADAAGRATLVGDTAPRVPVPVTGVAITIEPAGGSASPSDRVVARYVPPAPR